MIIRVNPIRWAAIAVAMVLLYSWLDPLNPNIFIRAQAAWDLMKAFTDQHLWVGYVLAPLTGLAAILDRK